MNKYKIMILWANGEDEIIEDIIVEGDEEYLYHKISSDPYSVISEEIPEKYLFESFKLIPI